MKIILSIAVFFISTFGVYGQAISATTDDGKKVVLKLNGTWEYVKEIADKTAAIDISSDCSANIETTTDRMTKNPTTSGKSQIIISKDSGKSGFGIVMLNSKDTTIVGIQAIEKGKGCMDEDTEIIFLLTDDSTIKISGKNKFTCDGKTALYFGGVFGNKEVSQQLSTKKIKAMRVDFRQGYVERDFSSENATTFLNQLHCLLQNRKK